MEDEIRRVIGEMHQKMQEIVEELSPEQLEALKEQPLFSKEDIEKAQQTLGEALRHVAEAELRARRN